MHGESPYCCQLTHWEAAGGTNKANAPGKTPRSQRGRVPGSGEGGGRVWHGSGIKAGGEWGAREENRNQQIGTEREREREKETAEFLR